METSRHSPYESPFRAAAGRSRPFLRAPHRRLVVPEARLHGQKRRKSRVAFPGLALTWRSYRGERARGKTTGEVSAYEHATRLFGSRPGPLRPFRPGKPDGAAFRSPETAGIVWRRLEWVRHMGNRKLLTQAQISSAFGDRALWSSRWMYVRKHGRRAAIELILSPTSEQRMDPQLLALAKEIARKP